MNTYEENIEIHQKHQASCPPAVYNMKPMQIPSTIPIKAISKPVNIPQISRVTPKRPALQEKVFVVYIQYSNKKYNIGEVVMLPKSPSRLK